MSAPRRPSPASDCSLDPRAVVGDLPAVQRALLAIVRALDDLAEYTRDDDTRGGLLILDEPTVFLPRTDRDRLFDVVRKSVAQGASVLFVSHDLDEALSVTDRITVLRDGRVAGTVVSAETQKDQLVEMIIGRRLEAFEASHRAHAIADEGHVAVDGISGGIIENVSFTMKEGEVLGLTGLVGSGFEEILYLLFGAEPAKKGRLTISGREYDLVEHVAVGRHQGGDGPHPGGSAGRRRRGVAARARQRDAAGHRRLQTVSPGSAALSQGGRGRRCIEYDVRPPEPIMDFQALSGGNQQKVVLAKWLQAAPKVLLVHEPTQGVDVGAQTAGVPDDHAGRRRRYVGRVRELRLRAARGDLRQGARLPRRGDHVLARR